MPFYKFFSLYLTIVNRLYIVLKRLYKKVNKLFTITVQLFVVVSNLYIIINKLFIKKIVFLLIVSKVDIKLNENLKVEYFYTMSPIIIDDHQNVIWPTKIELTNSSLITKD